MNLFSASHHHVCKLSALLGLNPVYIKQLLKLISTRMLCKPQTQFLYSVCLEDPSSSLYIQYLILRKTLFCSFRSLCHLSRWQYHSSRISHQGISIGLGSLQSQAVAVFLTCPNCSWFALASQVPVILVIVKLFPHRPPFRFPPSPIACF